MRQNSDSLVSFPAELPLLRTVPRVVLMHGERGGAAGLQLEVTPKAPSEALFLLPCLPGQLAVKGDGSSVLLSL